MTGLFLWIVKISIQASFVALVVMFVRVLLKDRPKMYSYALWLVVLLRLMLPVNVESSYSLIPRAVAAPVVLEVQQDRAQEKEHPTRMIPGEVPEAPVVGKGTLGLLEGITLLYGTGLGLFFMHFLYSHRKLQKNIRGAKRVKDEIYEGKSIEMPFSYGILKQRIYLPMGLTALERRQIIAHERVHLKRHDPLIKLLAYSVLLFHWFNPILWFSYILMTKDMEMSCDEKVLMSASKEERHVYARALLKVSDGAPRSSAATAYSLGDVRQRLKNIFSFRKTTWKEKVVFILVFIPLLYLLLTNPLDNTAGNVESALRQLNPVESHSGDNLEAFEEGGRIVYGRLDHKIDESFDKSKPISMQALRREFLDEKSDMMIHESLHFLPGDTIIVEDEFHDVYYDEVADATFLSFLANDGFKEFIGFKGDERKRFGDGTPKHVVFKFQVKPIFSFSDRFQILDYNQIYEETGTYPDVEHFLP